MSGKKVAIVTLGCPKNTSDTSALAQVLKARGHTVVPETEGADAVVVHTCSFIEAAKKESIDTILQAGRAKTADQKLIVTGCLVQQHGNEIFKSIPEVDAFLGTGQLSKVADVLEGSRGRFMDRANPGGFMDPDIRSPREIHGATATIRLSEGCSHPCSFCVIPRLRGPVQSRSPEKILAEVRELAGLGVEEFVVIGQDTGDWGREFPKTRNLPELLRAIAATPGVRWIRLMYMHPASFTDELLDVFADQPDKFPYLDMPFQHIDTKMLMDMKRKSTEAGLRQLLGQIHERAPRLTLRTTFIVGFPGETAAQFKRLLNFVKEGHFDYLGAFAYSKEAGTPAARRKDQVRSKTKQDRLAQLTEAYYRVAQQKAQTRIGSTESILIEESEADTLLGRSCREAPEIDAVFRLPRHAARQGRFASARITGYDAYEFTAQPA